MAFVRIVALGVVAAIGYGILHDQVTARVCVEYFTIGHARLIDSESPTVLALFWGVVATWWVGLPLGLMLATAARMGKRPALTATDLMPSLRRLLAVMYAGALLSGIIGFFLAQQGLIRPPVLSPSASRQIDTLASSLMLGPTPRVTGWESLAVSFWL
jgi:hypothetical protein